MLALYTVLYSYYLLLLFISYIVYRCLENVTSNRGDLKFKKCNIKLLFPLTFPHSFPQPHNNKKEAS